MFMFVPVHLTCLRQLKGPPTEIQPVIRFLNARNVLPSEIHHQICQVYGDNAICDGMVRRWVRMFNEGREDVHNETRSGCLALVSDDRHFTISHGPALSSDFKDPVTLSEVIWVIGKFVHDGCPRCPQRSTKNSMLHVL